MARSWPASPAGAPPATRWSGCRSTSTPARATWPTTRPSCSDLRGRLPPDCRLSITGLLDWSSQGDSAALDALGGVVDEVVLQTYQGRHTIPGYEAYLARLSRMTIPFKIGLVEGGDWTAPPGHRREPVVPGLRGVPEEPGLGEEPMSTAAPAPAPLAVLTPSATSW